LNRIDPKINAVFCSLIEKGSVFSKDKLAENCLIVGEVGVHEEHHVLMFDELLGYDKAGRDGPWQGQAGND
jgi:hypothetical protein